MAYLKHLLPVIGLAATAAFAARGGVRWRFFARNRPGQQQSHGRDPGTAQRFPHGKHGAPVCLAPLTLNAMPPHLPGLQRWSRKNRKKVTGRVSIPSIGWFREEIPVSPRKRHGLTSGSLRSIRPRLQAPIAGTSWFSKSTTRSRKRACSNRSAQRPFPSAMCRRERTTWTRAFRPAPSMPVGATGIT